MNFGEIVKSARIRLNLTQDQLAAVLSCGKPAISKWEANKSLPPITRLPAIAEALEIMPDALLMSVWRSINPSAKKAAQIDPLLVSAWQKLTPAHRENLLQIALILSQSRK